VSNRQRFIHPTIWQSADFIGLSQGARLLFIGLFSTADDEGRGKGRSITLKANIFPGDDIPLPKIERWAEEITAKGMARFYVVNGATFYDLPSWHLYQKPKYVIRSNVPPFQQDGAIGPNPPTLAEIVPWVGLGREGTGRVLKKAADAARPGFDRWWGTYPKKNKRSRALRVWNESELESRADEMVAAVEAQIANRKAVRAAGGFVPEWQDPERWLKNERWTDAPIPMPENRRSDTSPMRHPEPNRLLTPEERARTRKILGLE
jgi:hypothetical protein